jgi:hypothetical protein
MGWSTLFNNCYHPRVKQRPDVVHLIAGISKEHGLEGFLIVKKSVNSERFLQILDQFDNYGTNYTLLGDNASWHLSGLCKTTYR